jgi:very-short-patch-repair endonuclease
MTTPAVGWQGLSVIAGNVVTMIQGSDIERLLRRQHGAVARAQLCKSGLNANTIDSWVRRGQLRRVLPGVYSTGAPSLATRAHAAHLWQPEGVVSHLAAARLWKMAVDEPAVVHLTVPLSCARTSPVPWLQLFRRDTPRTRRSTVSGLPVTDVSRTIFDCLALLDDAPCAALLDHATATLTSDRALRMRYLEEIGLRGSPRIARQLASLVPGAASAPERRLARGLQSAGLTDFLINEPVLGYIADFLDPVRRLILEVDGYRTHGTWVAFQGDCTRQNVLVAHGYTILRYTAHDVQTRLGSILDEVAEVVARSSRPISWASQHADRQGPGWRGRNHASAARPNMVTMATVSRRSWTTEMAGTGPVVMVSPNNLSSTIRPPRTASMIRAQLRPPRIRNTKTNPTATHNSPTTIVPTSTPVAALSITDRSSVGLPATALLIVSLRSRST